MNAAASYDDLPYDDAAYFHTHPSTLSVAAVLRGFDPAPVETCRVLDLGCAAGFNLIAMSQSLPNARLVGIDYSLKQIDRGRRMLAEIGCKNVELHAADIASLDAALGEFDYIIAHGVYSWLPEPVADALLAACRRHLAPNGLAYISYNTLLGWHSRLPLRDLLRFHADPNLPLLERTRRARAAVQQILEAMPDPDSPAAKSLRAEFDAVRDDPDSYLFHEYLEADNRPVLFEQFAARAAGHGLRFLAEARFATNSFVQREPLRSALDAAGEDLVRREQQHDFLRNRHFRQSILCCTETENSGSPTIASLGNLWLRAKVENVATSDAVLTSIIGVLRESWPRMIRIDELAARTGHPPPLLAPRILDGFLGGLWLLFAYSPPFETEPRAHPVACPVARFEARRGCSVTNRLHRPVELTEDERQTLLQTDGSIAVSAEMLKRLAEEALLEL